MSFYDILKQYSAVYLPLTANSEALAYELAS